MKLKLNDHFLAWVFIYATAVFLSIQSIKFFNLQSSLWGIFLAGLIITLFSWIMYSFLYKNKFRLNKWFFIWLFTHSFNFWLIDLILRKLNLTYNGFFYFLSFGVVCHLVTWGIKHKIYNKIKMSTSKTLITILIFFIALLFASSQSFSEIQTTGFSENNPLGSVLNSLRNLVSFNLPLASSCPQIDIPMLKDNQFGDYITEMEVPPVNLPPEEYGGFLMDQDEKYSFENARKVTEYYRLRYENKDCSDPQKGWEILIYSSAELFGIKESRVFCRKGNMEGENPNYFYCDSGFTGGIPYLSKTEMNPDGTRGKTTIKSFINVYDSDKKFIKTLCGKSPEEITKEEFKRMVRDFDDFFSIK
jgi:hypothetical protein